jgi:nicotinic acid mononucleotide adenylyltransferase
MEPKDKKDKKKFSNIAKKYINTKPVLDEAAGGTAVVSWGRMNPVTSGHELLARKVASEARARKATPMIFLSHSSDPKKNPLSYDDKIAFAQQAFGRMVVKSRAKTIIEVAKEIAKQYANLVIVVGSDRVPEFKALLNKYNGKDYKFKTIEVVSAGERDPDADDVTGMSASKMRALAAEGDMESFKRGLPKKLQRNAEKVYTAVRDGMGITEETLIEMTQRFAFDNLKKATAAEKSAPKYNLRVDSGVEGKIYYVAVTGKYTDIAKWMKTLDEDVVVESLDEVLDRQQRRQRAMVMKKHAKKIARARARSMKKKASKEKLTGRAEKQVKQALKDKFAKGKNYNDLSFSQKQAIEKKIKKISAAKIKNMVKKKLPDVKKAEKARMSAQIDVPESTDLDAMFESFFVESSSYYKGVKKDKKDDREAHFKRKAKVNDDDPKAYTDAPGDKEAREKGTKPSQHTKKFKDMFGEVTEASRGDQKVRKRPHMLMAAKGGVKFDNRFKVYKAWKEKWARMEKEYEGAVTEQIEQLAEDIEFIFESNPKKALQNKAEKTGISFAILKKVFDRGVAAWRTGHRPGTTPAQWGLARVNSFATGGKTRTTADADLWAKHSGK